MNSYNFGKTKEWYNIKGRCMICGEQLFCDFTASGFEFRAELDGALDIRLELSGNHGMIGVIIDGDYDNMTLIPLSLGEQTVCAAKYIGGVHTIQIMKLTEYTCNSVKFYSVSFDGVMLGKPLQKKLSFDFYGDSLTCGYGNLSTSRNSPSVHGFLENGCRTWAVKIACCYDADYYVCASSGQGVLSDCCGNPHGTIDKYDSMCLPSKGVKWNFEKHIPDVVFINIGSNDINYYRFNDSGKPDWERYKTTVCRLFDMVRFYAPNCKIIIPMGHDTENPYFAEMINAYRQLQAKYENFYVYDDLTSDQLGADWHPNLNDHQMIFEKLKKRMAEDNILM